MCSAKIHNKKLNNHKKHVFYSSRNTFSHAYKEKEAIERSLAPQWVDYFVASFSI